MEDPHKSPLILGHELGEEVLAQVAFHDGALDEHGAVLVSEVGLRGLQDCSPSRWTRGSKRSQ